MFGAVSQKIYTIIPDGHTLSKFQQVPEELAEISSIDGPVKLHYAQHLLFENLKHPGRRLLAEQ